MHKTKLHAPLGASLVVLSSFFYASYGIWTKLMGNFFDGYTASALRSVLVLLILVPIAIGAHKLEPLNLKQNWPYVVGMLLASLLVWGPFYYAILHAGIGISLAINYASSVIGLFFFGWLFASEHLTRDKIIAALLGFIGLGLIFSPSAHSFGWLALLGAAVAGFAAAANAVFSKKIHYKSTQSAIALWSASVVANVFMAFVLHKSYPALGLQKQWFYLLLFGVASVVASWSLIAGIKLIDAGAAGVLGLLEIVFGVLFGVAFFHERPNRLVLVGVLVIIAAAAIPYFKNYKAQRETVR